MNAQQSKIDNRLRSIIINAFSVARWAYGAHAVGEQTEYTPPTILLISKGKDEYNFRALDLDEVYEKKGRVNEQDVADECVRLMVWGLVDYVLTVQECAMFVGDEEETQLFHSKLEDRSMFDPEIEDQIQKCCSFALYDISGVIVRTFATDLCCVRTFMMNADIDDLIPTFRDKSGLPTDDTRMSDDVADLSNTTWVLDECVPEELRDVGPLPSWSETLIRVLEDTSTMKEQ